MSKKPTPRVPDKADDKEQSKRFIETAQERETDETGKELERAFKAITKKKKT